MRVKGAINLNSALVCLLGIFFSFSIFVARSWIEAVADSHAESSGRLTDLSTRVAKVEIEEGAHWLETQRMLAEMKRSLDWLVFREKKKSGEG